MSLATGKAFPSGGCRRMTGYRAQVTIAARFAKDFALRYDNRRGEKE
jgi:hypothetical protein